MSNNRYGGVDSYAAFFIAYKARTLIRMPMFSRDDLEDLEQDMLLYYLLSMPDFDPQKGDKRSFIKTVVNRKALMLVRDAEREKRWTGAQNFSLSFQIGDEDDGNTLADMITGESSIWGDVFFAQSQIVAEQNIDIDKILSGMPDDLRQTYSLLTEYSVSEAAELLGIPRTTMSSRLKKLKKYIEGKMG